MAGEAVSAILGELESLTNDPKATEDYSEEVKEVLGEIETLFKAERLNESVEKMLILEKKCRQACDASSSSILCCSILRMLRSIEDWDGVNEYIVILCKKRGQLKRAIIDIVRLCMNWLEEIQSPDIKVRLLKTLSGVTEGKIFVEVERARLTRYLAHQKEAEGNIDEAAILLQDLPVETFGAMDRREKAEFILDQMRLLLLKNDYVRCQIISRKINPKLLEATDFQDIKLSYYEYVIKLYLHEEALLDICKAYYSMLYTPKVEEDPVEWQRILQNYTLYLLLAPYSNEQNDLLNKLRKIDNTSLYILSNPTEDKRLSQMPIFQKIIDEFLTIELMVLPLAYEAELKQHAVFQNIPHPGGDERWTVLQKRVIQHNIRVIGSCCSQMTLSRLSFHLGLTLEECEKEVSELVSSGFLQAKIDRPAGIVRFSKPQETCDYLNKWAFDVGRVVDLLEETSHFIQKEKMLHTARKQKEQMIKKNIEP
ncbi:putative 26s proteasome subunit p55 [Cardiosporidium cionae]|uniref:26s proteasome subunit p55 n=1 Tax=Cardiosporidium cionae TaxID=476202 RepID=A0ABQ7JFM6_9APIC|nr:putative 26s proteasome subunit p55 [Cardiosporidium cionae]|eukprot:KAF8822817.1 putative 26s proteasome subunit p55 [Cardiosporidium cionae]